MGDTASREEIAAATAYEELHVPALFRQWAPRVAAAAQIRPGQRVLDVACGTGILAREAAGRVGSEGSVTGLDAGRGMIAVAARLAPAIEWREGTAESLPFESVGVAPVEISTQRGTAWFPSIRTMVEADLRGWLPVMGVVLAEEQIGLILEEAEKVLHRFVTPDGAVAFDSPAHVVAARKK